MQRGTELLLMALLALTVLVQANAGTRSLGRDQGFYVYIGSEIVHGRLPYADAWEGKPPAIFYLNALGIWLGRGSRWGVWFIELVCLVAALWLSYELLKRKWGPWPAIIGTALWLYSLDRTFYGGGNFTEEYPLLLHFLSIMLMLQLFKGYSTRLYSFAIGVFFAVTFLFRPNNAALEAGVVIAAVIAWLSRKAYREMLSGLVCMAAGALIPLLVTGLYFWSRGLLQDLIDASLLYHVEYEGSSSPSGMILWTGFQILGIGVALAVLGYLMMLFQARQPSDDRLLYVFVLIAWPLTILVTDPAQKGFAHYYINWLPFIGLLSAFAVYWLQSHLLHRTFNSQKAEWAGLAASFVIGISLFVMSGRAAEYGKVLERLANRYQQGIEYRTPTALYVQNHTRPGERVLFWSAWPGENYMAERESPTASLYYPLYAPSPISTRLSEQFFRDLVERKPVLIVDIGHQNTLSLDPVERQQRLEAGLGWQYLPSNTLQVLAYIDQNYHKVAVVKNKTIYRLNGTE